MPGIASIIYWGTGFPVQYTYLIINFLLLLLALKILGLKFCLKTIFAVFTLTFILSVIQNFVTGELIHDQPFMSCVLGASFCGAGIGKSHFPPTEVQEGLKSKEINELLGVKSNGGGMWSIYTGKNICEQLPTFELWNKLENILDFSYPYEKLSITFNAQLGFTDVWDDINFYKERRSRIHPTQNLSNLLIDWF